MALFIWFLTQNACAQERKQITGKVFRFVGTAVVLGTILTLPKNEVKNTPLIGAGLIAVGFTVDLRNLKRKRK